MPEDLPIRLWSGKERLTIRSQARKGTAVAKKVDG